MPSPNSARAVKHITTQERTNSNITTTTETMSQRAD